MYQGHYIRKRFGQHFLHDQHIIKNIISIIKPQRNQFLLEIGPGLGALTKPILQYIDDLTVIEIDYNLATYLRVNSIINAKTTIFQQDVMNFNFTKLVKLKGKMLRIFGNIPYNISTKLIFNLFKYINSIQDMHFLLQKEVADRLVATPGNKIYGRLSIMVQYHCHATSIMEVPSNSFIPVPSVVSSFIRLVPYTEPVYPVVDLTLLKKITTAAFSKRRKTLRNSLLSYIGIERALEELSIDSRLRAEDISVMQYCQLVNWLICHKNNY